MTPPDHSAEEVCLKNYETYAEAGANIGSFVEDVRNSKRLHSALGYLPPSECGAGHAHPTFTG